MPLEMYYAHFVEGDPTEGRYRPGGVNAVGGPVDRCEAIREGSITCTDVAFVTAHAVPGKIVPLIRWRHTGRSTPLCKKTSTIDR